MKKIAVVAASTVLLSTQQATGMPTSSHTNLVSFHQLSNVARDSLHSIHLTIANEFEGHLRLVYGACDMVDVEHRHHDISSTILKRDTYPDRFVWVVPEDVQSFDCVHAYAGTTKVGMSPPVAVIEPLHKRESISEVADMSGPWFDGVATMASKENTDVYVSEAKSKSIAIVGGGMSGLLTSLLLDSVGIHDWHIIESSGRIGGRIRTKYLAGSKPEEYQYQEMG